MHKKNYKKAKQFLKKQKHKMIATQTAKENRETFETRVLVAISFKSAQH